MDAEELERFHWWVNSQLDVKNWVWSSPDKAGTEPILPLEETVKNLTPFLPPIGDLEEKYRKAYMVSKALHRPIVFVDQNKNYFDEQGSMVMLFDMHGEQTELGKVAIVLPMKPEMLPN